MDEQLGCVEVFERQTRRGILLCERVEVLGQLGERPGRIVNAVVVPRLIVCVVMLLLEKL